MKTTQRSSMTRIMTAAVFALLIAIPAFAKGTPNPNNGHGKITAISATSITVQPKNGDAKTFTITADTKVKLDKQPATVADLAAGQFARIKSSDGITALKIMARTHHGRKGGNAAGTSAF
jgi:hypothetical protein